MFRKLHLKMTAFCTAVTGCIFISMSFAGLWLFESLLGRNDAAVFEKNVSSVVAYLDGQNLIDYDVLARMTDTRFYDITIYEKGVSYSVHRDSKKLALADFACKTALTDHGFDIMNPPKPKNVAEPLIFGMKYENAPYLISFTPISNKYGTLCVTIIYKREPLVNQTKQLRIRMSAIGVTGCLLLFFFAKIFSTKILKPVEESRKKQIQFTASASHELRSPLAVILSSAEALKVANEEDRLSFYETIVSEGTRMSRLIDDMLSLSSADNQSWSMHFEPVPLDTLLLDLYETYLPLVRKKNLILNVELPDGALPCGICDQQRIKQVLGILLDNAISYTPVGGSVVLGTRLDGTRLLVWSANTGPCIPDEQKELIFDRFFRIDTSRQDKQHFGLGLCIAREIMRLHKGNIWVEDKPGGGCIFYLTLPHIQEADGPHSLKMQI